MIHRLALSVVVLFLAAHSALPADGEHNTREPDVILKDLYKMHDAQKGPFFDRTNRKLGEQYFAKQLAAMIVKDATASAGEVGAYEFDPLYASQDPQPKNFKLGPVERAGEEAAVIKVTFQERGKQREITFSFEREPDQTWRISDIRYPDATSLLRILRAAYPS